MSLRVNYTINPNLTIQYYGQPFISRGLYSNFKTISNAQANNFEDRFQLFDENQISFTNNPIALDIDNDGELEYDFPDGGYLVDEDNNSIEDYAFEKPDFSSVQFRSNLVIRWEYIPGSEIFLVWVKW